MWPSSSTAWCDPLTQPLRHGSEKMRVTPRKERWRYIFEAAPYICTFFYRAPKWEKTGKISLSSLHWVRLSLFNGPDIQPPPPTHLTFANWPRNSRGTKQSGPVRNLVNMQVWPLVPGKIVAPQKEVRGRVAMVKQTQYDPSHIFMFWPLAEKMSTVMAFSPTLCTLNVCSRIRMMPQDAIEVDAGCAWHSTWIALTWLMASRGKKIKKVD